MLSLFRKGGIAQVLLGGVVVTIILVFVLEFQQGGGLGSANLKTECVVRVQDYCVAPKEYQAAYGLVSVPGIEPKDARRLRLQTKVIDGLVERELLLSVADQYELSAGDTALDDALVSGRAHVSLPAADASQLGYYLLLCRHDPTGRGCEPGDSARVRKLKVEGPGGEFDTKLYERDLRYRTNRSPKEFKEMQRRELTAARMRELVRSRVQVSETEAFSMYERERSRATIRYVNLNRDWFGKYAADASEAAVSAWAGAHVQEVEAALKVEQSRFTEGCPLISEIRVDFEFGATDADKALNRDRIDSALERLKKKDSFAVVARETSDASNSALGGRSGCLDAGYGIGADELLKSVNALKLGDTSEVIETERGFHIVRLDAKLAKADIPRVARELVSARLAIEASAKTLVEQFAKETLAGAQAGRPLGEVVTELSRKYAAVPKKSESAPALEAPNHPKVEISAPFSLRDNPVAGALPLEAVARKVFELKLADALLPSPVQTNAGLCVVQLKEKELATRAQFDKEKALLMVSLRSARAEEALARYLADLRKKHEKEIRINPAFVEKTDASEPSPLG